MSAIEALYIFDEHNATILEHVYRGRPPTASVLLPLYLSHPSPQPSLIYLPNTHPPTLVYSIIQDRLLFLSPSSAESEPLLALEFLHRVADALEDFLGSPLLASKIESSYDVVAQLLSEMCDGGLVSNTEPNALRDVVEAPNWVKGLLGGVGLPSSSPSLNPSSQTPFSLPRPSLPRAPSAATANPVPWRRANVRHTSNELYVDIVETLSITLAPSGRPLSALAFGTVAFTAKVSGVPDLILQLNAPGGILNTISLPVFHPCVRLGRWKEKPGELSFVPPDGRFVLAGYEADLLGDDHLASFTSTSSTSKSLASLNLPATPAVSVSLGPTGADFEVRLSISPRFQNKPSASTASSSSRGGLGSRSASAFSATGTTAHPHIEEVKVHIPLPAAVRTIADLRTSRGDAQYAPGDTGIEWRVAAKDVAALLASHHGGSVSASATLRGSVVGEEEEDEETAPSVSLEAGSRWEYDEDEGGGYQTSSSVEPAQQRNGNGKGEAEAEQRSKRRVALNRVLMPSSATVSFSVKGWLASGIKVDALMVDAKRSKGLGAGVTPYKGVKYLTVSRKGVEARC
ncbi:clathrin adaptor, mu subunit [Mytilinidion resinicola]|uniref:Clathrin adaptor, mu subunit n=1 Tax=Mytilinidion resinicola TaxID=574789 RepID=A0A6A6YWM2_9PEZI|nr:clathrin adaptor, mu subunit [Mytilinidion resinicola]KAF2812385.1 clathrin adaptor, mu subunit [Mytilinidion resinicola]